jgi:hypothetical protein
MLLDGNSSARRPLRPAAQRSYLSTQLHDHDQLTAFRPQGLAGRRVRGDWEKRTARLHEETGRTCRISVALAWAPFASE